MRTRKVAPVGLMAPAVTTIAWALCAWEARRARSGEKPFTEALPGSGIVGDGLSGRPIRVAWLGDSLAAGLGCEDIVDTPAHLAARLLERPVEISMLAEPGARARDVLHDQLPLVRPGTDLVVVCVGANDVASATPRSRYAAQLNEVLTTLAPTPVIVLTLPDMAMADRMAQPLRGIAGLAARWFDAARADVVSAHAHVVSVDIASRPPGISRKAGRLMLCADRFHPGPEGYRVWAERIAMACHQVLEPTVAPTFSE